MELNPFAATIRDLENLESSLDDMSCWHQLAKRLETSTDPEDAETARLARLVATRLAIKNVSRVHRTLAPSGEEL
jgi:hypothetical protein